MARADEQEVSDLRDEARYWQRKTKEARRQRDAARTRASDVVAPRVEVVRGETWWRVSVNGITIDGWEEESTAQVVADRLRKAFQVK